MKSVATIINELRAMPVSDLVIEYESAFGKPPRVKHREWLWRKIAWRIQEQRFGGLSSVAMKRLDELIADLDIPLTTGSTATGKIRSGPITGTTVRRVWKGIEIETVRIEGGWEYDGRVYRSLSAVAKAVTGAHWNGKLFFGLSRRSKEGQE